MFWKKKTTITTTTAPSAGPVIVQEPPEATPVVVEPVADAGDGQLDATRPEPVPSVTEVGISNVATADREYVPDVRRSYGLTKVTQFVWLVAGVLEGLFAIRVILKLLAANEGAGFAQFINNVTAPFLGPFTGLLQNVGAGSGSTLEITTIIAMLVYALLAWALVKLLWIVFERRIAR